MNDERKGNGNTVLLTVIGVATLLVALVGATFAYFSATIDNTNAKESVIITTAAPVGLEYLGSELSLPNAIPGDTSDGTFTVENPEASTVSQTYDLNLIIDDVSRVPVTNSEGQPVIGEDGNPTYEDKRFSTTYKANNGRVQEDGDAALLAEQLVITITAATNGANTPSLLNTDATAAVKTSKYNVTDGFHPLSEAQRQIVNDQKIAPGEKHTYSINVNFKELNIPQDANQGKSFKAHIEISDPVSVQD